MKPGTVKLAQYIICRHWCRVVLILFIVCPYLSYAGDDVSEIRDVGKFDGVEFRGLGEVYLTQGGDTELRLVGDEALLEEVESFVDSGILVIKNDSWMKFWRKKPITVYIRIPVVKKLGVAGSGAIYGDSKIYSDYLKLELAGSGEIELDVATQVLGSIISGSGEIRLSGTTKKLQHTTAGSGDLKGLDLEAEVSELKISGSGRCELTVSDRLDVLISGSGKVFYRGNPGAVNQEVSGSGKIKKID